MIQSIKCFCKSKNTLQAYCPESQTCLIFPVISKSACAMEWLGQKSNCLSYMLLLFKNIVN